LDLNCALGCHSHSRDVLVVYYFRIYISIFKNGAMERVCAILWFLRRLDDEKCGILLKEQNEIFNETLFDPIRAHDHSSRPLRPD